MQITIAVKSKETLRISDFCKISKNQIFLNGLVSRSKTGSTKLVWVVDGLRRKTKGFLINLENRTRSSIFQTNNYNKVALVSSFSPMELIVVPLALELESHEAIGLTVGPWKS